MIHIVNTNFDAEIQATKIIQERSDGIIVLFSDDTWIVYGAQENTFSEVEAAQLGIKTYSSTYIGGACIVFPGDLSIMKLEKNSGSNFGEKILDKVLKYLREKGYLVTLNNNDLIIYFPELKEAKKIASCGSGWIERAQYTQSVVHFSINTDIDLVNKVCTKSSSKNPGRLADLGITAEEIFEVIKDLL